MTHADTSTSARQDQGNIKSLCRAVFDAMLDQDMLGMLLSSKHFHAFLKSTSFACEGDDQTQTLIDLTLCDEARVNAFHQAVLKMYSGVYIAECQHETQEALMSALDAKLATIGVHGDDKHTADASQANLVEMAWRYRRICCNSSMARNF